MSRARERLTSLGKTIPRKALVWASDENVHLDIDGGDLVRHIQPVC